MIKTSSPLEEIKEIECYDFLSAYKVERDPRIKIKLLALLHLRNGKTLREASEITFYDEKTIKYWLCLFLAFDYEGLIERDGRGTKPRLPPEEEELFKFQLD